jgi:hypothetical protein
LGEGSKEGPLPYSSFKFGREELWPSVLLEEFRTYAQELEEGMRQEIDPRIIMAIAAVVVVVLAVLGWRFFAPSSGRVDKSALNQENVKELKYK